MYEKGGLLIRRRCASVLSAAESLEPERYATVLVAGPDGAIFDAIAGMGSLAPITSRADPRRPGSTGGLGDR
ncbi:hypothetical protein [Amycolatopsis sp. PS_44_ISF1]|uniref:hypothetical protein n=1 Tax=Amycolatopsis sp. PS_44_ISF1 TaxID=2974917 RepID=UPI0028E06243|nr:hypothetical protein [Amycolatopsis sp. PS_44_ISF1]MDT8912239.1 hypothetical protein [Amycolatopsis sp. PS_44_ISF1]